MEAALLWPSQYIKSQELKGKDTTLTIATVKLEELPREDDTTEKRGVLSFKEVEKRFILNKTNLTCIQMMFGNETDLWIGKRVTFHPIPYKDPFTGQMTTATRVRGSPDITAPVSVNIKLKKRKASVMTMKPTAVAPAQSLPTGDQYEMELAALRAQLAALTTKKAGAKAWTGGMGGRVARLQPVDREAFNAEFKAHMATLPEDITEPQVAPMPA